MVKIGKNKDANMKGLKILVLNYKKIKLQKILDIKILILKVQKLYIKW